MGPWKLKEIRQLEEEIVQQKNGISQKHQGKKLEEEKQVVRSAGGQQEGCFPQKHSDFMKLAFMQQRTEVGAHDHAAPALPLGFRWAGQIA